MLIDQLAPGSDSYVLPDNFPGDTRDLLRSWSFGGSLRSVQWKQGGIVKNRIAFSSHKPADSLLSLLIEGAGAGIKRPSSYADFFHQRYHSPLVRPGIRMAFALPIFGGWQEQTLPLGIYQGTWYKYDIRSAYLWAASLGLPDPNTFRYSDKVGTLPGMYVADIPSRPDLPPPLRGGGLQYLSTEELEAYSLSRTAIPVIQHGVTWTRWVSFQRVLDNIAGWSCWKDVARSFWGRYASRMELECKTYKAGAVHREWGLKNVFYNPIWSHLITSRIRQRLWSTLITRRCARVYVDSVVVDSVLPTGEMIGDWKLVDTYCGLKVAGLNSCSSLANPLPGGIIRAA